MFFMMANYGVILYMSKQEMLLKHLSNGKALTPKQISASFGLKNPHRAIHALRAQGNCIYTNSATLSNGSKTTKYRLGKPSRRMVAIANAVAGSSVFNRTA
jgi:hypothetical protein